MELSDAARGLARRCEPRVNELARHMVRETFERLPGYAAIPGDMRELEIAATARHGMRRFLDRVRDPHGAHADDALFRERAAQRAEEGVPLQLLLRTHTLGVYVLWQALRDACAPGEEAALIELTELLMRAHESTVGAVAETYLEERAALEAERREHRRSLVRALLDGTLGDGTAAAPPPEGLGLDPARPCLVLVLEIPGDGIEGARGSAGVGRRRVLRRVQTLLDQAFGAEVPALLEADVEAEARRPCGTAVVPGAQDVPEGFAGRLRRACGEGVRAAAVRSPDPAEVPEAAHTASEVLRVARAAGLPPGVHRLDDVLLEFHLSRPSAGSRAIAALLDPVADAPELLRTLRVHLEARQRRRGTAELLGVHPNTVDNRLARISAATGLDLAAPRGAALAIAALLLREDGGAEQREAD
ncbi:helix-turn-helix domain-containing protein [Streptomyces sp. ODS28]|uniref:PucR family transcriptional regulator n=1 Tax=Streptomyces sp. ODS28 TaxID=3136688 RepID=UPI0031E79560